MTRRGRVRAATDQRGEKRRNPLAFSWPPCDPILSPRPKIGKLRLADFLSIAKAMVYHHALACISSPKVHIITAGCIPFAMMKLSLICVEEYQI